MDYFLRMLRAPGAKHAIEVAAPTQEVIVEADGQNDSHDEKQEKARAAVVAATNDNTYRVPAKPLRLARWLDKIVEWSGSQAVFFLILSGLIVWAFLGIIFSEFTDWQVGISDGQAIINLVFDSFLMRQQFNSYERTLGALGVLKSRAVSIKRMLRQVVMQERLRRAEEGQRQHLARMSPRATAQLGGKTDGPVVKSDISGKTKHTDIGRNLDHPAESCELFAPELPPETLFGRICTTLSNVMGHLATVTCFWIGIIIWISFGARDNWSSTWLLYINSATSALMVFMLAFLANIRERHGEYSNRCLAAIWKVDAALELHLRAATRDTDPNPTVALPAPTVGRIQRVINYYADLVGALVGIAILILTMVVWVAIGPVMGFNSNWWLLIGTYAGLVGMNDGFVLRNVFHNLRVHEDGLFNKVAWEDDDAWDVLASLDPLPAAPTAAVEDTAQTVEIRRQQQHQSTSAPGSAPEQTQSRTERISLSMGQVCSHESTVILGFLTIIGLVIGASAMGWSLTGQLLCNVPPSIIESFFMLILITGHNFGDQRRRADLALVHARRLRLLRSVVVVVGSTGDVEEV